MTTQQKITLMKARERAFKEMSEHYANLAHQCFNAHMRLDEQLQAELDAKFKYEQEVGGVIRESLN